MRSCARHQQLVRHLRTLVEATLRDRLSPEGPARFLAVLYYPREAVERFAPSIIASGKRLAWIFETLTLQFEIIREIRKTYRRDHVERLIPVQYRELFVELVSGQQPEFPRAVLAQIATMTGTRARFVPVLDSSGIWHPKNCLSRATWATAAPASTASLTRSCDSPASASCGATTTPSGSVLTSGTRLAF